MIYIFINFVGFAAKMFSVTFLLLNLINLPTKAADDLHSNHLHETQEFTEIHHEKNYQEDHQDHLTPHEPMPHREKLDHDSSNLSIPLDMHLLDEEERAEQHREEMLIDNISHNTSATQNLTLQLNSDPHNQYLRPQDQYILTLINTLNTNTSKALDELKKLIATEKHNKEPSLQDELNQDLSLTYWFGPFVKKLELLLVDIMKINLINGDLLLKLMLVLLSIGLAIAANMLGAKLARFTKQDLGEIKNFDPNKPIYLYIKEVGPKTIFYLATRAVMPSVLFMLLNIAIEVQFNLRGECQTLFVKVYQDLVFWLLIRLFAIFCFYIYELSKLPSYAGAVIYLAVKRWLNIAMIVWSVSIVLALLGVRFSNTQLVNQLGAIINIFLITKTLTSYRLEFKNWIKSMDHTHNLFYKILFYIKDVWHLLIVLIFVSGYFSWIYGGSASAIITIQGTVCSLLLALAGQFAYFKYEFAKNAWLEKLQSSKHLIKVLCCQRIVLYKNYINYLVKLFLLVLVSMAIFVAWRVNPFLVLDNLGVYNFLIKLFKLSLNLMFFTLLSESWLVLINFKLSERQINNVTYSPSARIKTLLPVVHKVVLIIILLIAFLVTLSIFSVNIMPFAAGLSFMIAALGVGLQTLVRDFFTGICILLEHDVDIGNIIKVVGLTGKVEEINIRVLKLRDSSGALHIVPFGELKVLTNFSCDYTNNMLLIPLGEGVKIKDMILLAKEVLAELRDDPNYGHRILGELEYKGLKNDEDKLFMKLKLKTTVDPYYEISHIMQSRMKIKLEHLDKEWPNFVNKLIVYDAKHNFKDINSLAMPTHIIEPQTYEEHKDKKK